MEIFMKFIKKITTWYNRPKSKIADFIESLIIILPIAFAIRTVGFGLYHVPTGSMETTLLAGEYLFADKLTPYFKGPECGDIITINDPEYPYSNNPIIHWWQQYVGFPYQVSNWTKRVIGKPGDHIKGTIENGKPVIYRNGIKLDEPYLNKYPLIAKFNNDPKNPIIFKTYVPGVDYEQQPYYHLTLEQALKGKSLMEHIGQEALWQPGQPCQHAAYTGTAYERPFDVFELTLGPDEYWLMGDNRRNSHDSRAWGPLKKELIHGRVLFRILSIDSNNTSALLDLLYPIMHPIDFWQRMRWSRCLQPVH